MPDILTVLFNACDPFLRATPDQWVDCNKERGGDILTRRFCRDLCKADGHVRFLLSGIFGSGKSSELTHLAEELRNTTPRTGGKRYFPVYLNADEYLDANDADPIDLLLGITAEIGDAFRDKLSINLEETYLKQKLAEVNEYLGAEVEANEGEINLWAFKVKIKRLASDKAGRAEVRKKLNKQEGSIGDALNIVFDKARLALKSKGYDDFVLILDNLEKIRGTAGQDDEETALYDFFIRNAGYFTRFNAHVIYTVPLRLVMSKGGELKERYGQAPFILPMIKVMERDRGTQYEAGYTVMREILQQHIIGYRKERKDYSPDEPIITVEEAIEERGLNLLIRYSGGSVRELMRYIREATSEVDDAPVTFQAARAALRSTIDLYSYSIAQRNWEKLARLDLSPDQQIENDDEDYRELLTQVAIMLYRNGGNEYEADLTALNGDLDGLNVSLRDEPWYSVHPVVRELSRFKSASEAEKAKREAVVAAALSTIE